MIRPYLVNQKEIAAVLMESCQKQETMNLLDYSFALSRFIIVSRMLDEYDQVHKTKK